MRKGHRQQIRWGQDHLEISVVDAHDPDRARFETYRQLHSDVAGRVTRGPASWDTMFELIAAGDGDLILCSLDGVLMGGTLMLDGGGAACYASGAYRRENFDKPLSHYPLFHAAQRAASAGARCSTSARSRRVDGHGQPKERAIGHFKSGFATGLQRQPDVAARSGGGRGVGDVDRRFLLPARAGSSRNSNRDTSSGWRSCRSATNTGFERGLLCA
jgi:hypothetical protein